MFPVTSRYHHVEIARWTAPDGREIVYLRRRFLPDDSQIAVLAEHGVAQDERLDIIAAHYLGDPEQFWRLCDANHALDPDELLEIGRWLRIPLILGG